MDGLMARAKTNDDTLIEGDTNEQPAAEPVADFDAKSLIGKMVFFYPGAEGCAPEARREFRADAAPFGGLVVYAAGAELVNIVFYDHIGQLRTAESIALVASGVSAEEGVAYAELIA
jgi:hypothetical protein